MRNLVIVSFLMALTFASSGQTQIETFIDSSANQLLRGSDIKSLSIGVVRNNKVQIYYYGDKGDGAKPNNTSYFEIASITKTFTGLLLAQAIQDKKINLDDDVKKFIAGNFSNLQYKGSPITFRNLATHMGGLPYTFPNKPEIFVNPDYDKLPFIIDSLEKGFTKNDFFRELAKVKLDTVPGIRFNYSNVGANLTAYILENIYKSSYENLLKKFIFKRAKMKLTKLELNKIEIKNLVQGYNPKGIKMPFYSSSIRAAGALKSTLPDMMKYVQYQLNEKSSVINLSHTPIWKEENGSFMAGYNWQMDGNNGNKKIFQNGGSFGTSSWLEFYPQDGIGFFLITNLSGPNIHNQLSELTNSIYKRLKAEK
jgi:CubicO group peptidase (beta-lactamase class C family)